ncbi:MAG: type II toxin-antitoxin system VapC family toxin [Nocardioidaceae bacterium]|nr:type II toxin-antitoxin system VapC family toxin [Nocardioidaceae bacterium]
MPVVDASVVVDWVVPDADPRGPSRRLLERWAVEDARVLAPRLLIEEVANALLTGCRRARWSGPEADAGFRLLLRLPVELADSSADVKRAWELSRRYDDHPVYDMLYVALAERIGHRLVTADARLRDRLVGVDYVVAP